MGYEGGTEAGRLFIDCLDDLFLKQQCGGCHQNGSYPGFGHQQR